MSLATPMGPPGCHKLGTASGALEPVGDDLPRSFVACQLSGGLGVGRARRDSFAGDVHRFAEANRSEAEGGSRGVRGEGPPGPLAKERAHPQSTLCSGARPRPLVDTSSGGPLIMVVGDTPRQVLDLGVCDSGRGRSVGLAWRVGRRGCSGAGSPSVRGAVLAVSVAGGARRCGM